IENNGFTGDVAGLVQQIQTYAGNSNAFDQAQGGLWSARFWNEFRSDGTTGVAAAALVEGLQNHNAGEVNAAAEQLAANSGGVGPDQVNLVVSDLIGVQQMLTAAVPQINNLSDLHTQIIINQLNEEIASVENANAPTTGTLTLGTDLGQFVGRSINDIHRDIIDIAQGDAGVQAIFNPTPLPDLATPPAPFHDNADQTAFVTQWIQDSNHLGQM